MKNSNKKVYCSQCKWWAKGYLIEYPYQNVYTCEHNENICYKTIPGNYYEPEHKIKNSYKSYPVEINKNNDCKWFMKKK